MRNIPEINNYFIDTDSDICGTTEGTGLKVTWQGDLGAEVKSGALVVDLIQACIDKLEYTQSLNKIKGLAEKEAIADLRKARYSITGGQIGIDE